MTRIVTIDLDKAKELHRQHLRARRLADFHKLDLEYQRADEVNDADAKLKIVAKKKILRDLPQDPRIEKASSIENLAMLRYPVLLGQDFFK